MTWIKLHTDIIDDIKVQKMSEKGFKMFVFLMLFCKERNQNGRVFCSLQDLKWRFRKKEKAITNALFELINLEIIKVYIDDKECKDNDDNLNFMSGFEFYNWNKRQYSDSYKRVKKHRSEKRYSNGQCNGQCNGDVTDTRARETDTETETDKDTPHPPKGVSESENQKPKPKSKPKNPKPEPDWIREIRLSHPRGGESPITTINAIRKITDAGYPKNKLLERTQQWRESKLCKTTPRPKLKMAGTWLNAGCYLELDDSPTAWDYPYENGNSSQPKPIRPQANQTRKAELL